METNKDPAVVGKKAPTPSLIIDGPIEEEFYHLAEILVKLRGYTKDWEANYGAHRKDQKKVWEKKADEWIERHVKFE